MTMLAIVAIALAAAAVVGPPAAVERVRRALPTPPFRQVRHPADAARVAGGAMSVPNVGSARAGASSTGNRSGLAGARSRAAASALAGVTVALFLSGPVVVLAVPVVATGTWWLLGRAEPAARVRERLRLHIEVPLAAELLAASVTAGCSVFGAVRVVGRSLDGPLGHALCRCAAAAAVGSDPAQVWAPLRAEPSLVPVARALEAAVARGTSPVTALQRIAADARLSARWSAEGRARALGARAAAPLGLCFLPAFVLLAVVPLVATSGADLF